MLFGTFILMGVAYYLGAPTLPLLVIAALLQGVAAFLVTRNLVAVQLVSGTVILALNTYFILPLVIAEPGSELPISPEWFDYATGIVALLGLVGATIIGVMGGPGKTIGQA